MKFREYYQVIDSRGRVRFETVYKIDAEFFARDLIRRRRDRAPEIYAVER